MMNMEMGQSDVGITKADDGTFIVKFMVMEDSGKGMMGGGCCCKTHTARNINEALKIARTILEGKSEDGMSEDDYMSAFNMATEDAG